MTTKADGALINGSGFEVVYGVQCLSTGAQANADRAMSLYDAGIIGGVVCTGGSPLSGVEFPDTEAEMTASYLLSRGMPHGKIELETESTSAVGNWANSTPIIESLGWETLVDITAKQNVRRMSRIGAFAAERRDFGFGGYYPTRAGVRVRDYAREFGVDLLLIRFLNTHRDTPLEDLETAYGAFKEQHGMATVKRLTHRKIMGAKKP